MRAFADLLNTIAISYSRFKIVVTHGGALNSGVFHFLLV